MAGPDGLTPRTSAAALEDRWNDASGGLGYHWRAWRYKTRLWAPFHAQVAQWLEQWRPDTDALILIGPSGGYALNAHFLSRFTTLIVLEPDPLARWLLRRRFPDMRWQFDRADVFHDPDALERLDARWPGAAFLFCNVVGQVFSADGLRDWQQARSPWLANRDWASWHDVFSSSRPPGRLPAPDEAALDAGSSVQVARALWAGLRCEVEDHGSFGWGDAPRYTLWQLTPEQWHVIGWVSHTRSG